MGRGAWDRGVEAGAEGEDMSEVPGDVQEAREMLRRLTVDLVYVYDTNQKPETEKHLALRRAAVARVRAWFLERE